MDYLYFILHETLTKGFKMNINNNNVRITDIDISFGRMIIIIFKCMFASIPAMILFYLIAFGIMLALSSVPFLIATMH